MRITLTEDVEEAYTTLIFSIRMLGFVESKEAWAEQVSLMAPYQINQQVITAVTLKLNLCTACRLRNEHTTVGREVRKYGLKTGSY